jgi:hypothetical protein
MRLGGFKRFAVLGSAGMMAWRWWKDRRERRNPVPLERDPRQSYDTGQASQSAGSF